MKKLICGFSLFFVVLVFSHAEGIVEKAASGKEKADMSYAFGMIIASDFMESGMEFNYSSLIRGFREAMEGSKTRFTMDEAMEKAQAAFQVSMEIRAELNRQQEALFLEENGRKSGIITAESGLQYEVLVQGTGRQPLVSDSVRVHYQGALTNGTVFDSSYDRGEPEEFPLQGVIPGFSEGILLMKEGGKNRLYIPSDMAYGSRGIGSIPPNSTLVFEIELLEIVEFPQDDDELALDFDEAEWEEE